MDLLELTKKIWKIYYLGPMESSLEMASLLDPECVIIGTGLQEFYTNVSDFLTAMTMEMQERGNILFQFRDFWCKETVLTPDVRLVYGHVYLWWESEDHRICIDMNNRFSMLYKQTDGAWRIVHIHLSTPNIDQQEGEFYPKSLQEQIQQSQEQIETLSKLAQRDSLTGLMNYRTFEEQFSAMDRTHAWLFIIDLDNFKHVNDTFGHLTGNTVLKKLSRLLATTLRSDDLVGRMGGDEFVLLCGGLGSEENACHLAQRLLRQVTEAGKDCDAWTSISMGITPVRDGESLESAFKRADTALYDAKKAGKNRFCCKL